MGPLNIMKMLSRQYTTRNPMQLLLLKIFVAFRSPVKVPANLFLPKLQTDHLLRSTQARLSMIGLRLYPN